MSRFELSSRVALALLIALASGNAAGAAPAGQEDAPTSGTLLRGFVRVTPRSATEARVEARFELERGGDIVLLLTWFPGQAITSLRVSADAIPWRAVLVPGGGTVRRIRIPQPPPGPLFVHYEVRAHPAYAYRFSLPVPDAPPTASGDPIRLEYVLPAEAEWSGGGFPRLAPARAAAPSGEVSPAGGGRLLATDLTAVPGFVHVVFGPVPTSATAAPAAGATATSPEIAAPGFGLNFYGFFLVALLWCLAYFGWATSINRERDG